MLGKHSTIQVYPNFPFLMPSHYSHAYANSGMVSQRHVDLSKSPETNIYEIQLSVC